MRLILLLPVLNALFIFSCASNDSKTFDNGSTASGTPVDTMSSKPFAVIAYYSGNARLVDSFEVEKLTHIIFSFGHLKGNRLSIDNAGDSTTIYNLVKLKSKNPALKVILSLGGWGGCEFCSPVFSKSKARSEFAGSVKELSEYFKTDGIDLDWEYPAIEGHPGHAFAKEDKQNFTALVKTLRDSLGPGREISFAAGGFDKFFNESIEWEKIVPLVDKINLMTYDLVHGSSPATGHLTSLYSTHAQKLSADNAIRLLDSLNVPRHKMIIGAAFYARIWENVTSTNNGLYQKGKFKNFVAFNRFDKTISADEGYTFYLDSVAHAPFAYNSKKGHFATFDDLLSVSLKTKYAQEKGLGGIMFWELSLDKRKEGLLNAIHQARK